MTRVDRLLARVIRARLQVAAVDALQTQPDSAASQPQRLGHAQSWLSVCGACELTWQPQEQSRPGQLAHWQGEASRECMGFPFLVAEPGGFVRWILRRRTPGRLNEAADFRRMRDRDAAQRGQEKI
jgi:hypothetical protein